MVFWTQISTAGYRAHVRRTWYWNFWGLNFSLLLSRRKFRSCSIWFSDQVLLLFLCGVLDNTTLPRFFVHTLQLFCIKCIFVLRSHFAFKEHGRWTHCISILKCYYFETIDWIPASVTAVKYYYSEGRWRCRSHSSSISNSQILFYHSYSEQFFKIFHKTVEVKINMLVDNEVLD